MVRGHGLRQGSQGKVKVGGVDGVLLWTYGHRRRAVKGCGSCV